MFDTIILLAGAVEQSALGMLLREHNPQLAVYPGTTPEDLADLNVAVLPRARLIAFSSPVIVPAEILLSLIHI